MPTFYEFFCGGGMVRAGLGAKWDCLFANDFDHKKCATYAKNWGESELLKKDIRLVSAKELPEKADLAWASFPCQDLSLAGGGAGLRGDRSGTFWPFWDLIQELRKADRAPKIVALENVCGTLTSHNGTDFGAICDAFRKGGYKVGALIIDAIYFLPQSRPRLFLIGVQNDADIPNGLLVNNAIEPWHTKSLIRAHNNLSGANIQNWLWWSLPAAQTRRKVLAEIIQSDIPESKWHSATQTRELLGMMDSTNKRKLQQARQMKSEIYGTMYRRTRPDSRGGTVQRIEVRFDDIAGCLRTPAGGSSRQLVIKVYGNEVRTRLLTTREASRLMGLRDSYKLPENYNEAYHLAGDGVAVPVVRHIAKHIFTPILRGVSNERKVAA